MSEDEVLQYTHRIYCSHIKDIKTILKHQICQTVLPEEKRVELSLYDQEYITHSIKQRLDLCC